MSSLQDGFRVAHDKISDRIKKPKTVLRDRALSASIGALPRRFIRERMRQ
jgi:hypothetical protein